MGQHKPAVKRTSGRNDHGFKLCPRCGRAVPASSNEKHCINDGEPLLVQCPACTTRIAHPYAKHCSRCGYEFALASQRLRLEEKTSCDDSVTSNAPADAS
jgi:DNA-directed RNA polymerase subunit RPC12/RpoP